MSAILEETSCNVKSHLSDAGYPDVGTGVVLGMVGALALSWCIVGRYPDVGTGVVLGMVGALALSCWHTRTDVRDIGCPAGTPMHT